MVSTGDVVIMAGLPESGKAVVVLKYRLGVRQLPGGQLGALAAVAHDLYDTALSRSATAKPDLDVAPTAYPHSACRVSLSLGHQQ